MPEPEKVKVHRATVTLYGEVALERKLMAATWMLFPIETAVFPNASNVALAPELFGTVLGFQFADVFQFELVPPTHICVWACVDDGARVTARPHADATIAISRARRRRSH